MNIQKPNIVIVVQGENFFNFFKNEVEKIWPTHSIYFLVNYSGQVLYKFNYPANTDLLEFPYITEPSWKNYKEDIGYVWHLENKETVKTDYSNTAILKSAEKIIFMCPFLCSADAAAFEILINQTLDKADKRCLYCSAESFDREKIKLSMKNPVAITDEFFQNTLKFHTAKRFFEYNFNFNSCILFRYALQKAGVLNNDFVFTKYVFQIFYTLKNKSDFSNDDMHNMIYYWKGTGLYPEASSLYSPTIVKNLIDAGLIEDNGNGTEDNKHYDFTKQGKALFKFINPECWDIDMLGKLIVWQDNWPESKKEMEDYLVQFFRKQMEFNG
ncbi:hypothetical protein [Flavobacterium johnsoniae]|uniref:hypothetical protein n=1 Tax=Flavobacterium johnsoniae TaxID=986 RepID=UPI003D95D07D